MAIREDFLEGSWGISLMAAHNTLTTSALRYTRSHLDVTIMLNAPCNYDCWYCCAEGTRGKWRKDRFRTDLMTAYLHFLDCFDAPTRVVRINAYGELTLVPGIWDFLQSLAERPGVMIMLATNLTFEPRLLWERVPPGSLSFILTSLHPETEADFEGFTARCRALRDRGYEVLTHFMVDDHRIDEARRLRDAMEERGLPLFFSPLQGDFDSKALPFALSPETKAFLGAEMEELHPQLLIRYGELAFTGMDCRAGHDRFCLRDMAISPCMNSDQILGWVNDLDSFVPFEGSVPCTAVHARAQCLPDAFIRQCPSHCMGDHRLPSSPAAISHHLTRFESFQSGVVQPARDLIAIHTADRIKASLGAVAGKPLLALFGVSAWPLLGFVMRQTPPEAMVVAGGSSNSPIPVMDPDDPAAARMDPSRLIVIHDTFGAPAALRFIATLSARPALVLDGLSNDAIALACRRDA